MQPQRAGAHRPRPFPVPSTVAVAVIVGVFASLAGPASALGNLAQRGLAARRGLSAFQRTVASAGAHQLHVVQYLVDHPQVEQVLILSIRTKESASRLDELLAGLGKHLAGMRALPVNGVASKQYANELEEMNVPGFTMTPLQREQWLQAEVGFGSIHKGVAPKDFQSNGMLACSLGHFKMWQMALNTTKGKWTVILEDDARPVPSLTTESFLRQLKEVPPNVDEVFLDDRHCGGVTGVVHNMRHYAYGSTAYAVTAAGARALLAVPFRYAADHWLNVPVEKHEILAYCPSTNLFLHNYKHGSMINSH